MKKTVFVGKGNKCIKFKLRSIAALAQENQVLLGWGGLAKAFAFQFDSAADAERAAPLMAQRFVTDIKEAYNRCAPGGIEIIVIDDYKDRI